MCMKLSEKQWECRAKLGAQIYMIRKQDKNSMCEKVNSNKVGGGSTNIAVSNLDQSK